MEPNMTWNPNIDWRVRLPMYSSSQHEYLDEGSRIPKNNVQVKSITVPREKATDLSDYWKMCKRSRRGSHIKKKQKPKQKKWYKMSKTNKKYKQQINSIVTLYRWSMKQVWGMRSHEERRLNHETTEEGAHISTKAPTLDLLCLGRTRDMHCGRQYRSSDLSDKGQRLGCPWQACPWEPSSGLGGADPWQGSVVNWTSWEALSRRVGSFLSRLTLTTHRVGFWRDLPPKIMIIK